MFEFHLQFSQFLAERLIANATKVIPPASTILPFTDPVPFTAKSHPGVISSTAPAQLLYGCFPKIGGKPPKWMVPLFLEGHPYHRGKMGRNLEDSLIFFPPLHGKASIQELA